MLAARVPNDAYFCTLLVWVYQSMTGAGFGGSAIALVPAGSPGTVADVVSAAFAARRFTPPQIMEVTPVDGAHRVA